MRLMRARPSEYFISLSAIGFAVFSLGGAPLAEMRTRPLTLSGFSIAYFSEIRPHRMAN